MTIDVASTSRAPGAVERWFAAAFADLHPLIQRLHRDGGVLRGPVEIRVGRGPAGWVGRRLARRLGVPMDAGSNTLEVTIFSDEQGLHWHRRFNAHSRFDSLFVPFGHYPDGYWIESSGRLQLKLQVAVHQGGWQWLQRGARLWRVPLPSFLLGSTDAGKTIVDGRYRFHVDIGMPLLGSVLSYRGDLVLDPAPRSADVRVDH